MQFCDILHKIKQYEYVVTNSGRVRGWGGGSQVEVSLYSTINFFFFSWDSTSFFIIRKSFCPTDILSTAGPQARTDILLEILPAEVTFKNCSSELKPDVTIQLDGFALFL